MKVSMESSTQATRLVMGKGFAVRAGAYVMDVVILWLTTLAISLVVGIVLGIILLVMGRDASFVEQQGRGLDLLIGFITSTIYFILFEWLYGATPGKLILGMRVIMEDGKPCTFGAACIRALLRYIDGLLFGLPAYASMKEPLLQRIGDKSAKTIVVGAKDSFIQVTPPWWWFILALGAYLGVETVAALIQTISLLR